MAKATHQRLTDRTLVTLVGQIVGTLEYMSPEQAVLNQLDVDTRADIYSLGVLLYELLVGVTPLDRERLGGLAMETLLRTIREEEPPRPSARLSRLGANATAMAAYRHTDVDALTRMLRGDLDWVVMKALEKDRSRRYDTASAFASDIERYLNNDAVEARPTSTMYRLRKFVRKNRGVVTSVATISSALFLAAITALWGWIAVSESARKERESTRELKQILSGYQQELGMSAFEAAMSGNLDRANELIEDAVSIESPEATIIWLKAWVDLSDGRAKDCIRKLENLQSEQPLSVAAQTTLAMAYLDDGRLSEHYTTISKIHERSPVTDIDYILWGEVWWMDQSGQGIQILTNAVKRRDTPLVRTLCARAMIHHSLALSDKQLALEAVKNITVAEIMAPDLPLVRDVSVLVHHGSALLSSGVEQETHILSARDAARSNSGRPIGNLYRAQFYQHVGEVHQSRHFYIEAARQGDLCAYYLAPFLMYHSPETALDEFNSVSLPNPVGPGALGAKALLLAFTPGSQHKAIEIADRVTELYADYDTRIDALCAGLLAGDRGVAAKAGKLKATSYASFHEFDKTLDFLSGACPQSELESLAKVGLSNQVHYYVIGMKLLNSGDRRQAKKYLELSAASRQLLTSYPLYARAILKQMERDSDWPQWLPAVPVIETDSNVPTQTSQEATRNRL